MIAWRENKLVEVQEVDCTNPDILVGKFILILIYFATAADNARTNLIEKELYKQIEKFSNRNLSVLGDFNAHIGLIGKQKLDRNGKKVLNLMEHFNLSLLNLENTCIGQTTWEQNEYKSTIDFIMTNLSMYSAFETMLIDENHEKIKISDHNFISASFKFKKTNLKATVEYYNFNKKSDVAIGKYLMFIKNEINCENLDIDKFNYILKKSEKKHLKVTVRKKIKKKER